MEILIEVVIDVDPDRWYKEYGNDDVRQDVRDYVLNLIQQGVAVADDDATVHLTK